MNLQSSGDLLKVGELSWQPVPGARLVGTFVKAGKGRAGSGEKDPARPAATFSIVPRPLTESLEQATLDASGKRQDCISLKHHSC